MFEITSAWLWWSSMSRRNPTSTAFIGSGGGSLARTDPHSDTADHSNHDRNAERDQHDAVESARQSRSRFHHRADCSPTRPNPQQEARTGARPSVWPHDAHEEPGTQGELDGVQVVAAAITGVKDTSGPRRRQRREHRLSQADRRTRSLPNSLRPGRRVVLCTTSRNSR